MPLSIGVYQFKKPQSAVTIAIFDPSIEKLKSELQTLFQHNVEFILTNISAWKGLFGRITESVDDILDTIKEVKTESVADSGKVDEADIGEDVIKLVNKVLAEAFIRKASDIHVEPMNTFLEFGSGSMEPFKKSLGTIQS